MEKAKRLADFKIIIAIMIAVSIGNMALRVLEKTPMNIWLSRGLGCFVCVIAYLLIDKYMLKKLSRK